MKIIRAGDYDDMSRKADNILSAQILLKPDCVLGPAACSGKASIAARAFWGPVTPQVPASILQMHPNVTLVADEDAPADAPLS